VGGNGESVEAHVWDRATVAQMLFVSARQLSELLILLGNRYTFGYARKVFRSASGDALPEVRHLVFVATTPLERTRRYRLNHKTPPSRMHP
jgi:hypothetical protein